MTEHGNAKEVDPNSVRKVVTVKAPPATTWRVFTEGMGTWWPLANYKIGKAKAVDAVIEPRVGGRWDERGDGDITADWQYDPNLKTELELRFIPDGKSGTRVELEHRRLDRFGARRDEMRAIFDTQGDWGKLLEGFARAAEA